jgi:hypothetical protein
MLTAPPSAELVARVRDLYHTRVSDVRFLIPVLNGLTKKEVIAALPKLIKLNPVVVKEVFNRFVFIAHFKDYTKLHIHFQYILLILRPSHVHVIHFIQGCVEIIYNTCYYNHTALSSLMFTHI